MPKASRAVASTRVSPKRMELQGTPKWRQRAVDETPARPDRV